MRRRYVMIDGELVEVTRDYEQPKEAHFIIGEIDAYESPVTGRVIDSRAKRRDDLRRTGSRPYEGFEQESKEAARRRQYQERAFESGLGEAVEKTYYQLRDGMTEKATRINGAWLNGD